MSSTRLNQNGQPFEVDDRGSEYITYLHRLKDELAAALEGLAGADSCTCETHHSWYGEGHCSACPCSWVPELLANGGQRRDQTTTNKPQNDINTHIMSDFDQAQYRRLKTRLTTKRNKLFRAMPARADASSMTDKLKAEVAAAARALIDEVDYANECFDKTGYPDAWADWERAKDDAKVVLRRMGVTA